MLNIWRAVLADVPDEALQAAALEYLRSPAQWRPVPGQLRTRALELVGGDAKSRAIAAWEEILSSNFGRLPVADPLAVRAMRLAGGFEAFGQSDISQGEWWQKRFVQFYEELAGKGDALALGAGQVAGLLE